MRRIYRKSYDDWSPAVKRRLRSANFGHEGYMLYALRFNPITYVMRDGDELIGWALVAKANQHDYGWGSGGNFAMFYVKKRYRRQGVGTKIANRIMKDRRRINFGANDDEAVAFFQSLGLMEEW